MPTHTQKKDGTFAYVEERAYRTDIAVTPELITGLVALDRDESARNQDRIAKIVAETDALFTKPRKHRQCTTRRCTRECGHLGAHRI